MIEDSQVPLEKLLELVGNQGRIWARVGAAPVDSEWTALAYDLVAPVAPPGWEERTWQYPEAVFCALTVTGPEAAEWLSTAKLTVCERELTLPGLQPGYTVRAQGLASGQQYGLYEPLLWPTAFYELSQQSPQVPQKMLVASDSPSFIGFREAAAAFFRLSSDRPMSGLPSPSVGLQDLTGRIARVAVHPAHVEVRVEGQGLQGLIVELASRAPGPHEELAGGNEQEVGFATPEGLLEQSWVVLKSGSTCVDRKFVNWIYSAPSAGVEITPEPATTLQVLIAAGEGPTIEFKQVVPADRKGRLKVCRTIAAFASGGGGHVLFGVEDDGQVGGLGDDRVTRDAQDAVTNWIRTLVVPLVEFQVRVLLNEDNKQVLDVEVQKGPLPPYGVEPGNPQYYVRRGATTFPASTDEVRTLARAHPATGQTPTGFNFK